MVQHILWWANNHKWVYNPNIRCEPLQFADEIHGIPAILELHIDKFNLSEDNAVFSLKPWEYLHRHNIYGNIHRLYALSTGLNMENSLFKFNIFHIDDNKRFCWIVCQMDNHFALNNLSVRELVLCGWSVGLDPSIHAHNQRQIPLKTDFLD